MTVPLREALATAAHARALMLSGTSLDWALERACEPFDDGRRASVQAILYGAAHRTAWLADLLPRLLSREPPDEVRGLLEVSLSELATGRREPHTLVNEAVGAARLYRETAFAAGMVNAVLRRCCRDPSLLAAADDARDNLPGWWLRRLKAARPQDWQEVLAVQRRHPPLTLRVNTRRQSVAQYLAELDRARIEASALGGEAILLASPVPVSEIPGFAAGCVSVQDAGSQLAARFLAARDGDRVLDACAAPGGKTAHILEKAQARVTAVEVSPERAERIHSTLGRLGLSARVAVADAADTAAWWDGKPFDRILVDAPCTASGIVRRHPDIPWQRRPEDIAKMAAAQKALLEALWPLLAPAGRLLYVVCSIFPEEGAAQIAKFCSRHEDARPAPLAKGMPSRLALAPTDNERGKGLPQVHDGYFMAALEKAR